MRLSLKIWSLRFRSSTLVEVIVALVIISLMAGISIMIYLNIQRSGFSTRQLSGVMILDEVYAETVARGDFIDKEFHYGNIVVYREIRAEGNTGKLVRVRLEARDESGKLLQERNGLVYVPFAN